MIKLTLRGRFSKQCYLEECTVKYVSSNHQLVSALRGTCCSTLDEAFFLFHQDHLRKSELRQHCVFYDPQYALENIEICANSFYEEL